MTGFREDFISVVAVLLLPLGLAAVFPYEAVGFAASRPKARAQASASIVYLDGPSVARAMRATKGLPRSAGDGRICMDVLGPALPGSDAEPMLSIDSRSRSAHLPVVESGLPPFLPSKRAAAPVRIVGGRVEDELPFPREELLKLK